MRVLYLLLAYLVVVPFLLLTMLWRGVRERGYWSGLHERFGFGRYRSDTKTLWIHAVSVGEVNAAAILIRTLLARYPAIPVVLSTTTPTGAQRARTLLGESVQVRYLPYDLPGSVRRFFDRVNPRLAVIFETELWPNLYHECQCRQIPLVLASARISIRSLPRYRRLAPLFRASLSQIVIAAQTSADAERFICIGADPARTHVTGNIKFDFESPAGTRSSGKQLRQQYAADRPVWLAASTHAGEEEIVLEAHAQVLKQYPSALLLLAPRHRDRFAAVAQWLKRRAVRFVTRTSGAHLTADTTVLLVDTLGELLSFYAAADVAYVGGSLVPVGGHNLLEPASLARAILTGPHNFNSADIAQRLIGAGAAIVVHDALELGLQVVTLLASPEQRNEQGARAKQVLEESRGALQRLLNLLIPLLQ